MAEFVLAPYPLVEDDGNRALLFVSKRLLAKEQADLQKKFETLTQDMSQVPFFVSDRSQTFEHKQKRSGPGAHSHMEECMVEELDLFLPSDLPKSAMKEHAIVQLGLKDNVATSDVPKQRVTAIAKPDLLLPPELPTDEIKFQAKMELGLTGSVATADASKQVATDASEHAFPYLHCEKKPKSLQLKACFVFIPPWEQSSLQIHYVSLNVRQKEKSFWNREETLEVDGTRSVMKFSMIRSTAEQVVSALKAKGELVEEDTREFHGKTNTYQPSVGNAIQLPASTASSDERMDVKEGSASGSNTDKPRDDQVQQEEFPQKRSRTSEGDTSDNQPHDPAKFLPMKTTEAGNAAASTASSTECMDVKEGPTESASGQHPDKPREDQEKQDELLVPHKGPPNEGGTRDNKPHDPAKPPCNRETSPENAGNQVHVDTGDGNQDSN